MVSVLTYDTAALAGMVIIQAQTILLPIPHLTADMRLTAPAPIIAPDIAWVVLVGTPKWARTARMDAPPVSATKPWYGFNCVIFIAIVFTIRQPPKNVPRLIANAAIRIT